MSDAIVSYKSDAATMSLPQYFLVYVDPDHPQSVFGPASYESCVKYKHYYLDSNPMFMVVPEEEYNPERIVAPPAKPFPVAPPLRPIKPQRLLPPVGAGNKRRRAVRVCKQCCHEIMACECPNAGGFMTDSD